MNWIREIGRRFWALIHRNQFDSDVQEEMRLHRELREREAMERGLSPQEAHYAAQRRFGNELVLREKSRDMWGWNAVEMLWRDGRYALRSLRKSPSFVIAAVAVLALGIGANTAIFTLMEALLFRPLPVSNAQTLDVLTDAGSGQPVYLPSTMVDVLQKEQALDGACGFFTPMVTAELAGNVRSLGASALTGDCFRALGIPIEGGRGLNPSDDLPGSEDVVVITDQLWRDLFSNRPDVLGSVVRLEGKSYRIVGITAPGFGGLLVGFPSPVMFSAAHNPMLARIPGGNPAATMLQILVRRSVSKEQAQAWIAAVRSRLLSETVSPSWDALRRKQYLSQRIRLESAGTGIDSTLRKQYGSPLIALFGLSFLVLLISCVNLANLILSRTLNRRREIAIRMATGARRVQIIAQLGVESGLLALAGGVAGTFLAYASSKVLIAKIAAAVPGFSMTAAPDTRILLYTIGLAVLASLLFGLLPAWRSSYLEIATALKEGGRSMSGSRSGTRRALIVGQMALAMALVSGAGLFAYSLRALYTLPLGFHAENVIYASLFPLPSGYERLDTDQYYHALIDGIRRVPGVLSASIGGLIPFAGFSTDWASIVLPSGTNAAGKQVNFSRVSEGTLRTLGIALLRGRDFTGFERAGQPPAAIISQSLADRLSPQQDAIGKHLILGQGPDARGLEIVGIAQDAQVVDPKLRNPLMVYTNYWQEPRRQIYPTLLVRVQPGFSIGVLQKEIASAGHEYAIQSGTLLELRDRVVLRERLLATLATAFGSIALILAGAGLYGLFSYHVAGRTGEFGVRLALGANPGDVAALVVKEAALLLAWSVSVGLPLTFLLGRTIQALLFGVKALNPIMLLVTIAALSLAVAIAIYGPMRRAAKTDPMLALRNE